MEPRDQTITQNRAVTPKMEWVVAEPEKPDVEAMVRLGIEETRKKYGKDSEQPKPYHNEEHVVGVVEAVEKIGTEERLTDKEIALLKIAAGWHDVETGMGPGVSEDESARLCQKEMTERGFEELETQIVSDLIRATKNVIIDGVIKQEVGDPEEVSGMYRLGLMKRVMADADLSGVGEEWEKFRQRSLALGEEAHLVESVREKMSEKKWQLFWEWQYGFLDGFLNKREGFYTDGARRIYPNSEGNLKRVRELKWRAGV